MIAFDAPNREKCTARRSTTNTPLQALVLMNDPTYLEAARALAERVITEIPKSAEKRVELAFRIVTSREASGFERTELTSLAKQQFEYFRKSETEARQLLTNGESRPRHAIAPVELATWTMVASAILNLDETITKQ